MKEVIGNRFKAQQRIRQHSHDQAFVLDHKNGKSNESLQVLQVMEAEVDAVVVMDVQV